MFEDFDKGALDDPAFKEDSVREEIVAPMIKRLGYGPSGPTRVQRSKALTHPYVHIGTRKHPISIVPDYTLIVEERPLFILDAKAPSQDVLQSSHVEQAYSYAMHPEIRCHGFGLCNGRQLAVYDVREPAPLLVLPFEQFDLRWPDIDKFLGPRYLLNPEYREFQPDFGVLVSRMGLRPDVEVVFPTCRLQMIGRVNDGLFTVTASASLEDDDYMASFDFSPELLDGFLRCLARPLAEQVRGALSRAPFMAHVSLMIDVSLRTRIGVLTEGQDDWFVPFIVTEVLESRLNRDPPLSDPSDLPANVFRLKRAFEKLRKGS